MDVTPPRDQEIARLAAEVARLQSQLQSDSAGGTPAAAAPRTGRGRAFLAALVIALGVILAPLAVVAAWMKTEVTDTDRFVATMAPIIDDPAFQAFLVDEIDAAINESIDTITSDPFAGISTLGLPLRAASALQLLEQPAVVGARLLIRSEAERLITSNAFEQVWGQALRTSHTQLTSALSGDTSRAVVIGDPGEVGIQLGPIVAAVKVQLTAQGFALADRIPEVDRTIVVALVPLIYSTALAVGMAGVTIAIVAYLAGPFRGATAVRRLTVGTPRRTRAAAESNGATTGRFGSLLFRARRLIRIGIAVIGAAIVLFVRPLTPGVMLWTAVGALIALLLLELLQRPPVIEVEVRADGELVSTRAPTGRDSDRV